MTYEVVTCAGHVLATVGNLEDAEDVRDTLERKLRRQGFTPIGHRAWYGIPRLVSIRPARTL